MHALLDKYLCEKYPKLFADRNKPMNETCMCWGFSCGNGWFSLIDTLCSNIQHHIDNPPWVLNETTKEYEKPKQSPVPQVVVDQVKEKFSGLRFYYHGGDEYIHALVDEAENLSYFICEECGRMDESVGRNKRGWIQTTCSRHARSKDDFNTNGGDKLKNIWEQVKKDEKNQRRRQQRAQKRWEAKDKERHTPQA